MSRVSSSSRMQAMQQHMAIMQQKQQKNKMTKSDICSLLGMTFGFVVLVTATIVQVQPCCGPAWLTPDDALEERENEVKTLKKKLELDEKAYHKSAFESSGPFRKESYEKVLGNYSEKLQEVEDEKSALVTALENHVFEDDGSLIVGTRTFSSMEEVDEAKESYDQHIGERRAKVAKYEALLEDAKEDINLGEPADLLKVMNTEKADFKSTATSLIHAIAATQGQKGKFEKGKLINVVAEFEKDSMTSKPVTVKGLHYYEVFSITPLEVLKNLLPENDGIVFFQNFQVGLKYDEVNNETTFLIKSNSFNETTGVAEASINLNKQSFKFTGTSEDEDLCEYLGEDANGKRSVKESEKMICRNRNIGTATMFSFGGVILISFALFLVCSKCIRSRKTPNEDNIKMAMEMGNCRYEDEEQRRQRKLMKKEMRRQSQSHQRSRSVGSTPMGSSGSLGQPGVVYGYAKPYNTQPAMNTAPVSNHTIAFHYPQPSVYGASPVNNNKINSGHSRKVLYV